MDVRKVGGEYEVLVRDSARRYTKFRTEIFVNALGYGAEKFAHMLGIETGLYPVKHQAFITKRLPLLGKEGAPLDMLIDRRHYKGFSAVYGQQLADTGQIIGCASPATDPAEAGKDLRINTQAFLEIASEVFSEWIPTLKEVGIQATWAGYYVEPRYIGTSASSTWMPSSAVPCPSTSRTWPSAAPASASRPSNSLPQISSIQGAALLCHALFA